MPAHYTHVEATSKNTLECLVWHLTNLR